MKAIVFVVGLVIGIACVLVLAQSGALTGFLGTPGKVKVMGDPSSDQPPITVADGSVRLTILGSGLIWQDDTPSNAHQGEFFYGDPKKSKDDTLWVIALQDGGPNCGAPFEAQNLKLTAHNASMNKDDVVTLHADGKTTVRIGKGADLNSVTQNLLDLDGDAVPTAMWVFTEAKSGNNDCKFSPTATSGPILVVQPFVK